VSPAADGAAGRGETEVSALDREAAATAFPQRLCMTRRTNQQKESRPMSSFPTDQVAVTLTSEEWTTITGGLSRHGSRFYRQATAKLRDQVLAASDAAQSAPRAADFRKNSRNEQFSTPSRPRQNGLSRA
jgi:hypothetical protein